MTWGTGNWPGTGIELDPYQVPNADALNEVRNNISSGVYYKQTADISLADYQSGNGWVPASTSATQFQANYDGDSYKIFGFRQIMQQNHAGIFGYINTNGSLKNIRIYDAQQSGNYRMIGILCGSSNGNLENIRVGSLYGDIDCFVSTTNTYFWTYAGGVCSYSGGTATNIFGRARVTSPGGYCGGVIGPTAGTGSVILGASEIIQGTYGSSTAGCGGCISSTTGNFDDLISYSTITTPNATTRVGGCMYFAGNNTSERHISLGDIAVENEDYNNAFQWAGAYVAVFSDIYWDENIQGRNVGDGITTPRDLKISTEASKLKATYAGMDFDNVYMMLTVEEIESVCGEGYGQPVYDALPERMKDRPFFRSMADVLIEGITPAEVDGLDALFFGGGF